MIRQLDPEGYRALQRALCGTYSLPVCDGRARIVAAPLPGRAVCAATEAAGVVWVILDFDKPSAHRHARAMVEEWRELYLGANPDGERQLASAGGPPTVPLPLPLRLVS